MLKITGCILVIASTTLLGFRKGADIEDTCRQLQYLQRLFYLLQSEIRYARTYLGEIFIHLGKQSEGAYREWLLSLGEEMEKRAGKTFEEMWREEIKTYLTDLNIPSGELERLLALGSQLGNMDTEMRVRTLDLYQEQLARSIEEMREGMKGKVRLCHSLGIMGGMFLSILFL